MNQQHQRNRSISFGFYYYRTGLWALA